MNSSGPALPPAPKFFEDPNVADNIGQLSALGQGLSQGQFLDPSSKVGFLNPLVSQNPEATQQAIQLALRPIQENQALARQNTINQLAANGQLQSSTTANALGQLDKSFSQDVADVSTRFHLADVERSLGNIQSLFGLGVNTLGNAGNLGLQNQSQRNQFNLANFENEAAVAMANQKSSSLGSTIGSIGGMGLGFALGGPMGASIGAGLGGSVGSMFDSNPGQAGFGYSALGVSGLSGLQRGGGYSPMFSNQDFDTLSRATYGDQFLLRSPGVF